VAADKKKARKENAKILLIDECGLLLAPLVRRTLGLRGQTPVMRQRARHRDKVSVIAAVGISPRIGRLSLYFQTFPLEHVNNLKAADFLKDLLRQIPGKLIVVWDNGNMHRGDPIRQLLAGTRRLHLERLPPYAPDCNPVEFLWKHVKYDKMANFCAHDVPQINQVARRHFHQAARSQHALQSFINQSELSETGNLNT
jgi:transposase